jgi:hypothetical protein
MAEKPTPEVALTPAVLPADTATQPAAPLPPAESGPPETPPASPPVAEVPKPVEPERTPTLLEKHDAEVAAKVEPLKPAAEVKPADKPTESAKDAPKPAEPKAAETAKPAETEKPAEPAKPEPVEYKYTLPETIKLDDARKAETHAAFDLFRADPTNPQPLIDLHNKAMTEFAEQTRRDQFDTFNKTKADWEKVWMADAEIGGAGYQTSIAAIARARDLLISSHKVGTPQYLADRKAFDEMLAVTGAGSHPAFGRLLHNAARFVDEPQAAEIPTNIKPPANIGRAPGSFKDALYDNPRSRSNGSA